MRRIFPCAATLLLAVSPAFALPKTTGWTEVQTPNFTIHSHASARQTKKIATDLERFREVLNLITRGFEFEARIPTSVYVFRNDHEMLPYKTLPDGKTANVSGYFMSRTSRNYFVIDASAGNTPRRILYHEYLHLLLHTTFEFLPTWLDEGLAEYYSTFVFRDNSNTAEIGHPIEGHLRYLAGHRPIPLEELFETTTQSPTYNEGVRQGMFYAQSWMLVHYLAATDERRKQLGSLLMAVHGGEDPDRALQRTLGVDLPTLEEQLAKYILKGSNFYWIQLGEDVAEIPLSVREMGAGEVLYELGNLLVERGRWNAEQARLHLDAALEQDGPEAEIYGSLGYLAERQGSADEARRWYEKAVAGGTAGADLYARAGRFLLFDQMGQDWTDDGGADTPAAVRDARRLLRTALEKDSDNVPALAALGKSYLIGGDDPASARAVSLRPFRTDILQDLACLLVKAGRVDEAKTLITTRLRPNAAEPESVFYAEQWVVLAAIARAHELMANDDREGALAVLDDTTEFVADASLQQKLAQVRATIETPRAARGLSEDMRRLNEVYGLADDGRFDEALAILDGLLESCTSADLCDHWKRTAMTLRERAEQALFVDRYNHAIQLANSGDSGQAIEVLHELERSVADAERLAKIRETLKLLETR